MGMAHVGLVHCDPYECKVKRFPPLRGTYQKEALARGATFSFMLQP